MFPLLHPDIVVPEHRVAMFQMEPEIRKLWESEEWAQIRGTIRSEAYLLRDGFSQERRADIEERVLRRQERVWTLLANDVDKWVWKQYRECVSGYRRLHQTWLRLERYKRYFIAVTLPNLEDPRRRQIEAIFWEQWIDHVGSNHLMGNPFDHVTLKLKLRCRVFRGEMVADDSDAEADFW